MIILPIINKGRIMFAEVTLKDAQKIHSGVVFEGMQESDVIVNQQPYSESSYLHDKEDSSVVSFIRNSSLISQKDFMVTTREERESSKYDVYQVKQPPKFVNKALDNLYASVITDMRKELPGTKKGRYISLDKLGLDDELSDEKIQTLKNVVRSERNSGLWPRLFAQAGIDDIPKTLEFLEHFDCTIIPDSTIAEDELQSVLSSLEPLNSQDYHNLGKTYRMAKENQSVYSKLAVVYHEIYQQPYRLIQSPKQRSRELGDKGYQKVKAPGEVINFGNEGHEFRRAA